MLAHYQPVTLSSSRALTLRVQRLVMSGLAGEGGGAPAQPAGAFRVVAGAGIPFLSQPRRAQPQAVPGVPARHTGAALVPGQARSNGSAPGHASSEDAARPSGAPPPAEARSSSAAPARAESAAAPGEQAPAQGTAAAKAQAVASGAVLPALFTFDGDTRLPPAPAPLASLPEEAHPAGLPDGAGERDLGSSPPPSLAEAAAGGCLDEGQTAEQLERKDSLKAGSNGAASEAGSPSFGARDAMHRGHVRQASLKASVSLGDWITPAAAPPRSASAPREGPDPATTLLPAAPQLANGADALPRADAGAGSVQHVGPRIASAGSPARVLEGVGAGTGAARDADGSSAALLRNPGHEPGMGRAGAGDGAATQAGGAAGDGDSAAAPPAAAAHGAAMSEADAARQAAQEAGASAAAAPPALATGSEVAEGPRELGAAAPWALAPSQAAVAPAAHEPPEQLTGSPHAPVSAFAGAGSAPGPAGQPPAASERLPGSPRAPVSAFAGTGSEPGPAGLPPAASEQLAGLPHAPVSAFAGAAPEPGRSGGSHVAPAPVPVAPSAFGPRGAAGGQPAGDGPGLQGPEALEGEASAAEVRQGCTERDSSGAGPAPAAERPPGGGTGAASAGSSHAQSTHKGLAVAAAQAGASASACDAEGADVAALAHERVRVLHHLGPAEAAAAAATERSGAQALPAPEAAEPGAGAAGDITARNALAARVDALEHALAEAHDAARCPLSLPTA